MGTFTDDRRDCIVGTDAPPCQRPMQFSTLTRTLYFAGQQVKVEGRYGVGGYVEWPQPDRLSSNARHHPYGEERGTSSTEYKFATYQRESSGLDYAMNRYYSSVYGRFLSSDPYRASGGPSDPGSWNRYAYVQGDPVNFGDSSGLDRISFDAYTACLFRTPIWEVWGSLTSWDKKCLQVQLEAGSARSPEGGLGEFPRGGTEPSRVENKQQARAALKSALRSKADSKCWKMFLSNVPLEVANAAANGITFFDGRSDTGSTGMFGGPFNVPFAVYPGLRPGAFATTLTNAANVPTPNVVLWGNFFKSSASDQEHTLWHEFIHVATKLTDEDMITNYASRIRAQVGETASGAFDRFLLQDCPD
ncbi:MAG: RHS repeat-associated core domain-containing protein [Acidobacteria bacterium]|nr:RHS repeat-associated core domain-containing protein [Acidobacteriota bacterium]